MLEIKSFKEMVEQHQKSKVPFRVLQEIGYVLLGMCDYTGRDIAVPTAITQQEINWLMALPVEVEFMTYLGGWVYICETEDDLMQVTSMDFEFSKQHGRWPNVTEAVLALDEAKYLFNVEREAGSTADGSADYVLLYAATNNAGGPSWFIPKHLWQVAQIHQQIEANHQYWS